MSWVLLPSGVAPAAIIGTNPPAKPLTAARIALLPAGQRADWIAYRERSDRQRRVDQRFLQQEMLEHEMARLIIPPEGKTRLPLDRPGDWYGGPEARRIADVVLSFQTPAGGWSKNLDMTGKPRSPGMHFAPDNSSRHLSPSDFDRPQVRNWDYVGTFDNNATITQLRYLARVISATDQSLNRKYRTAFVRGLDYIFAAQYPDGGWPQVWPLEGGYHDAITLNDNAMLNVLGLLHDVASDTRDFAFVSAGIRKIAAESFHRGLECLLAAQVSEKGRPTAWAQQYDPLTLQPESARNYEMPALASGESAGIMIFLMRLSHPDPKVVSSVNGAATWFEKTEIRDFAFKRVDAEQGRRLISAPGQGPLWARYYRIGDNRPIFGDRDKTIHDDVNELSRERRNGYGWFGDAPKRALAQYAGWSRAHRPD